MPGLVSRLTAKTPDDLWAAYHEQHPMAFDLAAVKNSDDFIVTLDTSNKTRTFGALKMTLGNLPLL